MIEIFVVIKDKNNRYYLLKIQRSGFDVYCFPPHLGVHYSLHESGKAHFRPEGKSSKPRNELPVMMIDGEAGAPIDKGIIRENLVNLGHASCIYTTIYSIKSLSDDFRKFNRSARECFVIDRELFTPNTSLIEIGVWAVPERNEVSFEFNNPDIPKNLLYKLVKCEPQIWIYARPI
ncbi:MAG TPA: hypothetical protein G4O19_00975 [Dehalococcoidia bacterium]|nr:hypothetical protein [Dehalococcoidia bacterium]